MCKALFVSYIQPYAADIYPANFPPSESKSIQQTFCMLAYCQLNVGYEWEYIYVSHWSCLFFRLQPAGFSRL